MEKKSKIELFIELANINENGESRWVNTNEFVNEYSSLRFTNGADWARTDGTFGKKYIIEFDKTISNGNRIDRLRTIGLNNDDTTNAIRTDIKNEIKKSKCVVLGTSKVEVDHKNGLKNNTRVMNTKTQLLTDFQPLSKAANDAKRQHCKECERNKKRFDAKKIGYKKSFIIGDDTLDLNDINACVGCYWFDVLEFKKNI